MRSLIVHANKFESKVIAKSNWPKGIIPEQKESNSEYFEDSLVVFFCVEEGDSMEKLDLLYQEIIKTSEEINNKKLMIAPFVHLSNNIAKPEVAKELYLQLMKKFENTDFMVKSSHFGYHKTLLLDIKGYPGSFRYREF